jgi:hypothetical protein
MDDRLDGMAHMAASAAEFADLVAGLVEEGDPSALPLLLAPDLVRLIHDLDTPGEVVRTVLEFIRGLQIVAQIRCDDLEGLVA